MDQNVMDQLLEEEIPVCGETVSPLRPVKKKERLPKGNYPQKRQMNLWFRPDKTTKPATMALYVLFVAVCLLGLAKVMVYDVLVDSAAARQGLRAAESERDSLLAQMAELGSVQEDYSRYSETAEERALIDRMEVLDLLERSMGAGAMMWDISIEGDKVLFSFSCDTLAETARIVKRLEASPLVESTLVSTASTTYSAAEENESSGPIRTDLLIQLRGEAEK